MNFGESKQGRRTKTLTCLVWEFFFVRASFIPRFSHIRWDVVRISRSRKVKVRRRRLRCREFRGFRRDSAESERVSMNFRF